MIGADSIADDVPGYWGVTIFEIWNNGELSPPVLSGFEQSLSNRVFQMMARSRGLETWPFLPSRMFSAFSAKYNLPFFYLKRPTLFELI